MDRACLRTAVAGALTVAVLAARADDPPTLEKVEVIGRYDDEIGVFDSASQGEVTRDGILKRPLLRPGEVLEAVPGMAVTQHSGDGKANQYFLRGYNLDHGTDFATWVAGMPVNMPTHAHGQGYTDLNFVIPELISRVLFNKGPYFAQDGDFASVGSARIQYVDRLPANLATLTYGSFDYVRALFAGSPELGRGNLVYAFEYQHTNGPWEKPANFNKYNGVLRYAQGTPANGFNVTAMAYSASWNSTDQIAQRAVDQGLVGFYGTLDPTDGGKSSRYSLSGEWRQSDGNVSRAASLYAIRSKLDLYSNFTYFLDNPVNGDQFLQSESRVVFGGDFSQTWFTHWGDLHVWNTVGLQLRRDRMSPVGLYSTEARQRLSTTRAGRRDRRLRRAVFLEHDRVDALVPLHRRAALRLLPLRRIERQPGELGQEQRQHPLAQALADLRAVVQTPSTSSTGGRASTATTRVAPPSRSTRRPGTRCSASIPWCARSATRRGCAAASCRV